MNKKEIVQGLSAVFAYLFSGKVSFLEKALVSVFVLAYIISPFDLIPDIPVIGWLDDIGVGALFVAYCAWRVNHAGDSGPKAEKEIIDVTPRASRADKPDK